MSDQFPPRNQPPPGWQPTAGQQPPQYYPYPTAQPSGYPPTYPPQYPSAYPQPYGGAGYPPATPAPKPPARPGLMWSWIAFVGVGVICMAMFGAFAVLWVKNQGDLGIPQNANGTYGTLGSPSGDGIGISVSAGAPLVERTETHVFGRTNYQTDTTRVPGGFTSIVVGVPSSAAPGSQVAFWYSASDPQDGHYLSVSPAHFKATTRTPGRVIAALLVGIVSGLIGVILLIVWLVSLHRRRSAQPMATYPLR